MTLLELCDTNGHVSLLNVYVRDEKSVLLHTYRIGPRAKLWMADRPKSTTIIEKPLHVQDAGASNFEFGLVKKNIPKQLRDMEVTYWRSTKEYPASITDAIELSVDVAANKTEEQMKQVTAEVREAEANPDQITLF